MKASALTSAGTASDQLMQTVPTALTTLREITKRYRVAYVIPIGLAKVVSITRSNPMPMLESVTQNAMEDVQALLLATVFAVLKVRILINLEHVYVIPISVVSPVTCQ